MRALKIFPAIGFIILATIFIQACNKSNDYNTPPPGGGGSSDTVTIQAMSFSPPSMVVVLGTKITWKNLDTDLHTVTADDGISFNSGNISTNGVYSFTFTSIGTFPYHCTLHPGMTGSIYVVTR